MSCVWIVVAALLAASIHQLNSCELVANGECICWPNDIFSYCTSRSCSPFDYDGICLENTRFVKDHILPDEWVLLFDSYEYIDIIGGQNPAWLTLDSDGDGNQVRLLA